MTSPRTRFLVTLSIAFPTLLHAQTPRPCSGTATANAVELRACIDTLISRHARDSSEAARNRVAIDSLAMANRQALLAIQDIYTKLPPNGQTVAEYSAKRIGRPDSAGTVINGDLIVNGRLCIPDACIGDAGEQIQIRAQKAAGILFQSNRDGTWEQSACAGISTVGMSPDLGLRLIQNQRWSNAGTHVNFICPGNATGSVGFDSQAEWSFNGQKPGRPMLGTQRLVIRTDEDAKVVYFATWAEGWKMEFRSSADGCKWCENVRWKVPYQPQ